MNKISGITRDPKQRFTVLLPNNKMFTITLEYKPMQIGWFCGVTYGTFKANSLRVTTSLNILSQFSGLIPFGIACFTREGQEPFFTEDFELGNAALVLLDQTDLLELEAYLGSKV